MMPLFRDELVRLHLHDIQKEAAERRRLRGIQGRRSARFRAGTLLITLGEALRRDAVAAPQAEPCLTDGC